MTESTVSRRRRPSLNTGTTTETSGSNDCHADVETHVDVMRIAVLDEADRRLDRSRQLALRHDRHLQLGDHLLQRGVSADAERLASP